MCRGCELLGEQELSVVSWGFEQRVSATKVGCSGSRPQCVSKSLVASSGRCFSEASQLEAILDVIRLVISFAPQQPTHLGSIVGRRRKRSYQQTNTGWDEFVADGIGVEA